MPREVVFLGSGWRAKTDGMGHSTAQGAVRKQSGEGEMRWLQDQLSGEDKHEEQLHVKSKSVFVGLGA